MQFMTVYTFRPEHANSATERFLETGGQPPKGAKMISRWHDVSGGRGFALSESDDPVAMTKWCRQWNDLLSFEIIPVVTDEQVTQAISE